VSGGIPNLIAKVAKQLQLTYDCPGSKYSNIFHTTPNTGYVEDPDEENFDD